MYYLCNYITPYVMCHCSPSVVVPRQLCFGWLIRFSVQVTSTNSLYMKKQVELSLPGTTEFSRVTANLQLCTTRSSFELQTDHRFDQQTVEKYLTESEVKTQFWKNHGQLPNWK